MLNISWTLKRWLFAEREKAKKKKKKFLINLLEEIAVVV